MAAAEYSEVHVGKLARARRLRSPAGLWIAVVAALALSSGTGLAAETQWRFDGTVYSVSGPWSQSIAVDAPVRGVIVLDRDQSYVQVGNPCDGSATRTFYSVREARFFMPGASGAGTNSAPPGVDCAPDGLCDVAVTIVNVLDPPGCQNQVFEVDFEASPLASAELGDVALTLGLQPALTPPAFFATIPDSPWAASPGGLFGQIGSSEGVVELALTSLTRAQVCGDINFDLDLDGDDVSLLRAELANPSGAPLPAGGASRCSVIGGPTDCDVRDATVLRRALAGGLGPGVQQVCTAMNGG